MATQSTYVETWLPGSDGHQFYTRTYPATFPKAVVLFAHGFAEHIGRYEHAHSKYPSHHITVFAFDQRGYGRTALDTEHRSKDSSFGKTSWKQQMGDIEHFAKHLKKAYPDVPLFLMGHSMGGGLVLAYFTRATAPPSSEGVSLFKGVISSSPFLILTNPKPKPIRWMGGRLSLVLPTFSIPADVDAKDLSRNPAANEAYLKDPLIKRSATLLALDDMLSGGEKLVAEDWKRWPKDLPALFIHGTADRVTSPKATEQFYEKIECVDKKLSLYEGGYHELVQEIDDIPERLLNELITWIQAHIPASTEPASVPAEETFTANPESKL